MLHLILLAALIDPTLVPSTGSITKDFVPTGWHIVQEVEGELTGAGKPEVVVQLVENGPLNSPHGATAHEHQFSDGRPDRRNLEVQRERAG